MNKCIDCGLKFEEPKYQKEPRGEVWGAPAFEEMPVCPNCGGDYEILSQSDSATIIESLISIKNRFGGTLSREDVDAINDACNMLEAM